MAEIHQTLLSQFSLLAELFIVKALVKDRDSRVLKMENGKPGLFALKLALNALSLRKVLSCFNLSHIKRTNPYFYKLQILLYIPKHICTQH
jgi:hypothetical protein